MHTEMGIAKGLVCCEYDVPFICIGAPMMGGTGPATLEGTLVQTVAECLSGLVIFQKKAQICHPESLWIMIQKSQNNIYHRTPNLSSTI